jgi:hypothetical protein
MVYLFKGLQQVETKGDNKIKFIFQGTSVDGTKKTINIMVDETDYQEKKLKDLLNFEIDWSLTD